MSENNLIPEPPKLIIVSTNSAKDNDGSVDVMGVSFKGNQFMPVLGGLVGSIVAMMIVTAVPALKPLPLIAKLGLAAIPLVFSVVFMLYFFQNRPPHFMRDWFQQLFLGKACDADDTVFRRRELFSRNHPRLSLARQVAKRRGELDGLGADDAAALAEEVG